MKFGKVGVLFGGSSAERDISLLTGNGVLTALRARVIDAHGFDTGTQSLTALAAQGFARVFIALHGRFGEDGSIQGALEMLGIPYTGSGVMASAVANDKIFTKRVWANLGLPTPAWRSFAPDADLAALPAALGLPLIVKPPHEGSTIGITRVDPGPLSADKLQAAVALVAQYDDAVLAEQFIAGRELTVAILGSGAGARALPIVEIVAPDGNYDYQNKYFTDDTRYLCPAPLTAMLGKKIQDIAVAAFNALDCEGWGRVDVMLDQNDMPWLLEVNTSPGMTGHSLVPMAARATGMAYEDLCVEILAGARLKIKQAGRN